MSAADHLSDDQFGRIVAGARMKGPGHDDASSQDERGAGEEDLRLIRKTSSGDGEDMEEPRSAPMSGEAAHRHNTSLHAYWHQQAHQESPEVFGSVGRHCANCVRYGLA